MHGGFGHSYDVRHKRIDVLATGPVAIHQAMICRWPSPSADQIGFLTQRGISIVAWVVAEMLSHNDHLTWRPTRTKICLRSTHRPQRQRAHRGHTHRNRPPTAPPTYPGCG